MTSAFRFVLPVTIFLSIFGIVPQGKSQTYQGKELVKAELVADTTAFRRRRSSDRDQMETAARVESGRDPVADSAEDK